MWRHRSRNSSKAIVSAAGRIVTAFEEEQSRLDPITRDRIRPQMQISEHRCALVDASSPTSSVRCVSGVSVPPRGPSFSGTGDRLLPGRAIEIQGYGILDGTKILVAGKTSRTVRAVAARLGATARNERRGAGLVRIDRPQLLRRLRVNRSFGYYFVVVPTKALRSPGNVVIEARDRRDRLLDREVARAPDLIR